jgi:two-component system phosphate regulon sensor histidine kinase PhoR
MTMLAAVSIALVSIALCLIFYQQFTSTIRAEIKGRAEMFREMSATQLMTTWRAQPTMVPEDMRLTLIAPDGKVIYDNTVIAEKLGNHADRPEIRQALATGSGASSRYSDTLRRQTCYFAVRLPDGFVLRTAKTSDSIFALFGHALPLVATVILVLAVLSHIAAGRLTNRIVEPINAMRLDDEPMAPPYDELTPLVRAISEQRQRIAAQFAALEERTATIDAIMDSMSEGTLLLDQRGTVVAANPSAGKIFGFAQPVAGRNILELLREPHLARLARQAVNGHRHEETIKRHDRHYRAYFSPVTSGGAALLFLDITESGKAERLRREFSANVSHELKTPLTSISGYAEMLASGMVREEDQAEFLAKIRDESARMLALIEDILLLSRLDEEKSAGALTEVDIGQIATEAAAALADKAAAAGIGLRFVAGKAVSVKGSGSLLNELLFNLLDNAIKYNRPGGMVEIGFGQEDEGGAIISVRDTGIGIPPEARSHVFERFYRVDKSRSKTTGGTGLGLAIVKHIALIHKAEINLTSEVGEGTTVTVIFPAPADV